MKLLFRILVVGILIVAMLAGVSYFFPRHYHVERSITIEAPAASVFAQVGDLRAWPRWTVWSSRDPAMRTTYSENTAGVGATMAWDGPEAGKGELKVTAHEAPERLVYDLYFPDFEMRSVGQIILSATGPALMVTWSDAGDLGMNPLNRWFGLTLDKMVGSDFEEGLANLKRLCEKPESSAASP